MLIPDNYDIYEAHERQVERRISRLPKCNRCGEPITSEYAYDVDGLWCERCFDEYKDEVKVDMDFWEDEQ